MENIKENDKIYVYSLLNNNISNGEVLEVKKYNNKSIHIKVQFDNNHEQEFWYYNKSWDCSDIFMSFIENHIVVPYFAHINKNNLIEYVKHELNRNIKLFADFMLEFDNTNSTLNNIEINEVEFNGKTYPLISVVYNGQLYDISTKDLDNALANTPEEKWREARHLDETIFYYMETEDYAKINLCRPYIIRDYIINNIIRKI